jgi:hypothetical protein
VAVSLAVSPYSTDTTAEAVFIVIVGLSTKRVLSYTRNACMLLFINENMFYHLLRSFNLHHMKSNFENNTCIICTSRR